MTEELEKENNKYKRQINAEGLNHSKYLTWMYVRTCLKKIYTDLKIQVRNPEESSKTTIRATSRIWGYFTPLFYPEML